MENYLLPGLFELLDVHVTYPFSGLYIQLIKKGHPFKMNDITMSITLPIGSKHDDQRVAACKSLIELMQSLNLKAPESVKLQPPPILAAEYARKLKTQSYAGWIFAKRLDKLPVILVKTEQGISKHHHKRYVNYHFSATGKEVPREDVLVNGFVPMDGCWRLNDFVSARAKPIAELPEDFLFWFDQNHRDRGDLIDANLIAKSMSLKGKKLQYLFYLIKMEIADVLCYQSFYGRTTANLPCGIFKEKQSRSFNSSLTGLLMKSQPRPDLNKVYQAAIHGLLPDEEWNDLWESKLQIKKANKS